MMSKKTWKQEMDNGNLVMNCSKSSHSYWDLFRKSNLSFCCFWKTCSILTTGEKIRLQRYLNPKKALTTKQIRHLLVEEHLLENIMDLSETVYSFKELRDCLGFSKAISLQILHLFPDELAEITKQLRYRRQQQLPTQVVLDTSIISCSNCKEQISRWIEERKRIVLTDAFVSKLTALSSTSPQIAWNIGGILDQLEKNAKSFIILSSQEEGDSDCLLHYLQDHKQAILYTANNELLALSTSFGIRCSYWTSKPFWNRRYAFEMTGPVSLRHLFEENGALKVHTFLYEKEKCILFRNNIQQESGDYTLQLRDDIFLMKEHENYTSFAHFIITKMEIEDGIVLAYRTRIQQDPSLNKPIPLQYLKFLEIFFRSLNS